MIFCIRTIILLKRIIWRNSNIVDVSHACSILGQTAAWASLYWVPISLQILQLFIIFQMLCQWILWVIGMTICWYFLFPNNGNNPRYVLLFPFNGGLFWFSKFYNIKYVLSSYFFASSLEFWGSSLLSPELFLSDSLLCDKELLLCLGDATNHDKVLTKLHCIISLTFYEIFNNFIEGSSTHLISGTVVLTLSSEGTPGQGLFFEVGVTVDGFN